MVIFGLATWLLLVMWKWLHAVFSFTRLVSQPKLHPTGYKKINPATILHHSRRKPNWALKELTRLKAQMPDAGCRTLADTFNRLFAHRQILVCKSTAYRLLGNQAYAVLRAGQSMRSKTLARLSPTRLGHWT